MGLSIEGVKKNIEALAKQGNDLYIALSYHSTNDEQRKEIEETLKRNGKDLAQLPKFNTAYEVWYSEALLYIKKFIPDRVNDFSTLYKNEKRKEITAVNYTISDAIIGATIKYAGTLKASPLSAAPKLLQQVSILRSTVALVDSVIYSMNFTIRSELFDSELDAAAELLKSGFLRAAGAMCGVILEKHLAQVCMQHEISLKKKSPTISDYNDVLKDSSIIDLPTWRYLQMLGDLRNICCHDKNVEPTKEQANDLLTGTQKITKTVF